MDDKVVETFLIKKLKRALPDVEHSVFSGRLCKAFNHFSKNKETNTMTPKEKLYSLNNVMAECQMVLNKNKYCCAPLSRIKANNVSRSLKEIHLEPEAERVEKPEAERVEKPEAERVEKPEAERVEKDPSENCRWISHSVDETKIHGIDDESMVLEWLLVGKERKVGFQAIAIVGATGVGKTTLCQIAFNKQAVRKDFAPRIWVYLPKQSMEHKDYKKEVVKNILMCLGYEDKLIDEIASKLSGGLCRLLLALRLKLKGKRYLIVLDGDWNSDERFADFCSSLTKDGNPKDQLASGFPKEDGGTVIVMSRSKRLAADMVGEKNLHRLVPLADDESCWNIFVHAVGKEPTEDTKNLKDHFVKECAGVPLIAKIKGKIYQELHALQMHLNSPP